MPELKLGDMLVGGMDTMMVYKVTESHITVVGDFGKVGLPADMVYRDISKGKLKVDRL